MRAVIDISKIDLNDTTELAEEFRRDYGIQKSTDPGSEEHPETGPATGPTTEGSREG